MITKIWLHEYGPFREAELRLAPLTVLVGPNASGKTMAMEALVRVRLSVTDHYRRRDAKGETWLTFEQDDSRYCTSTFSLLPEPHTDSPPPVAGSQAARPEDLPPIRSLKFEPQALREPSYLEADELVIQENGYGLATVLADMKLQDDERLGWIEEQVGKVIPSFQGVRFHRAPVRRTNETITGQELIFDMKNAHGLSPDLVSDGTILVLGIVTSIASITGREEEGTTALILIDDLERGLHPRALRDFVGCLRRMTEEMSVQILATSHSPYLLDWLRPDEVRLTNFLDDGTATICELSDHPEFERWKDVMTPGEFWSTAGEDWVRDVRS